MRTVTAGRIPGQGETVHCSSRLQLAYARDDQPCAYRVACGTHAAMEIALRVGVPERVGVASGVTSAAAARQEAGSYHVLRGKQVASDVSPIGLFAR